MPVLSEFVANNVDTLFDENGDASDWFEIENRGDSDADLSGYFVTNDLFDLDKWQIPDQTRLAPNASMIVFASGKDQGSANEELHTNFDLDESGGSIVLVNPDGQTIASEFRSYPALAVDESFARTRFSGDASLIQSDGAMQWFVPTDDSLGTEWTEPTFDAAVWADGSGGLGYQVFPGSAFNVELTYSDASIETFEDANVAAAGFNVSGSRLRILTPTINHSSVGGESVGNYLSDAVFPKPFSVANEDFVVRATTAFEITSETEGDWTFGLRNDDGSRLFVDGVPVVIDDALGTAADTLGTIELATGFHELEYWYWHNSSDVADSRGLAELFVAPGRLTEVDSSFRLIGSDEGLWSLTDIGDFIQTDVQSELLQSATSVFARYPFEIDDPSAFQSLTLEATFQGGFAAYVNGQLVGSQNLSDSVTAFAQVALNDSLDREQVHLLDLGPLLVAGENTLAIHGVSSSQVAAQFLVQPSLKGRRIGEAVQTTVPTPGWTLDRQPPAISEFQASNVETLFDEDGESQDWIEIHNPGTMDLDLSGWYLTDNPNDLEKWQFPNTILHAGEYLVVFASSKDRTEGELHTNFRLGSAGEYLALVEPNGESVATEYAAGGEDYPRQFTDVSFGITGESPGQRFENGEQVFFLSPTPGSENGLGVARIIASPTIETPAGIYSTPFDLSISSNVSGGAVGDELIYVTFDGSEPSPNNPAAALYTQPIRVDGTTIIRAAVVAGELRSQPSTATYLFLNDVVTQSPNGETPLNFPDDWGDNFVDYGMDPDIVNDPIWSSQLQEALTQIPSISIVMNLDDMFGDENGIYANPFGEGREWERPASLELLDAGDGQQFQVDAGIRIRGGFSRDPSNAKHSFRFFFRRTYGDSQLHYPMFGDEGADEFDKLDLRTAQNYSWSLNGDERTAFIRDVFSRDAQSEMDQPYSRSRPYHLYINGQYWGLYETEERKESRFAATYLGGEPDDFDVITQKGVIDGNLDAWNRMAAEFQVGLGDDRSEAYYRLQGFNTDGSRNLAYERLLDVDNLMDYVILQYYTGDWDSAKVNNNSYAIYNRENPDGFKFLDHDSEHSLNVGLESIVTPSPPDVSPFSSFWMHEHLIASNSDYRQRFIDRVDDLFSSGGVLAPENVENMLKARAELIDQAVIAESARWGDRKRDEPFTKTDWEKSLQSIYTWIDGRTELVIDQLIDVGFHSGIPKPQFDVPAGNVLEGTVLEGTKINLTLPATPIFETTLLVQSSSGYRYIVPDAQFDATFGDSWTLPTFEGFNGWETGVDDLGFSILPFLHRSFATQLPVGSLSTYMTASFDINDTNADGSIEDEWDSLLLQINVDDGLVAYLNGDPVASINAPESLKFDAVATDTSSSGTLHEFVISPSSLQATGNILAFHVMNDSPSGADMSIKFSLAASKQVGETPFEADIYYTLNGSDPRMMGGEINPAAVLYKASDPDTFPTIAGTALLQSRAWNAAETADQNNDAWSPIAQATYTASSVGLIVSEINYNPFAPTAEELAVISDLDNDDFEFVELQNVSSEPIELGQFRFSAGIELQLPEETLAPFQRALVVRNENAFGLRYGFDIPILGEYNGGLSNGGERIAIANTIGDAIWELEYDDSELWPARADGIGATLELRESSLTNVGQLDKYYEWRGSHKYGGTPGEVSATVPGDSILISEVRTNTSGLRVLDAIELQNPTPNDIDIGGWFLSDSSEDLFKYQIPLDTKIAANDFLVLFESDFGRSDTDGDSNGFALGANGDDVWLVIPTEDNQQVETFVDEVHFGALRVGETAGRVGEGHMRPLARDSLGCENAGLRPATILISEVNYNPGEPTVADLAIDPNLSKDDLEFVEIANATASPVNLGGYRIDGGVAFEFAEGFELAANNTAVVVPFNTESLDNAKRLQAFRNHYDLDELTNIVGGFSGQLSDSGEAIRLLRSPETNDGRDTGRIEVDSVIYDDRSPWPTEADGRGQSIIRVTPATGEHSSFWSAGRSPGRYEFSDPSIVGDLDGDGFVSPVDIDMLLDVIRSQSQVTYWDQNGDSRISEEDLVNYLSDVFATAIGDVNLDGQVDTQDHAIWSEHRFSNCGTWSTGDLNGDGTVDGTDFNRWSDNRFREVVVVSGAVPPRTDLVRVPRSALHHTVYAATELPSPEKSAAKDIVDQSRLHDIRLGD